MRLRSRELFSTIHTEGGLLPGNLLRRVADGDSGLAGLDPASYHLPQGERLNEAITRSWTRLQGAWRSFAEARAELPADQGGASLTRERWLQPLFNELGYGRLVNEPAIEIESKRYPVFSRWQNTPIHLVGVNVPLDRRSKGVAGASSQSPHSLVQELLNRSPERLWGIVSNGLVLRLLRDNVALTRQSYVEFDLAATMEGELYSDFVVLWLTCHQSRVEAERPEECWLESWSQEAAAQGTRALDTLREGVQQAISALGGGFLAHPANARLHDALRDGELGPDEYYRQLLRIVYRLLFLFVAEDRGALLVGDDARARERFSKHYSTARLRGLAMRHRGSDHDDLFEALGLLMEKLHEDGCPELALPALGSELWSPASIGGLAGARIANTALLDAVRELAFVEEAGLLRSVDFRNLGAEELGSVYESLLELHPRIDREGAEFELGSASGSERKTSGSFYTPTPLISHLLDSALDPVLEAATAGKGAAEAEAALLEVRVCDPACGSGHFLIAAANRIAKRLAAIRTGDDEPSPEALRTAVRDVVGHCLYGVDANPMAVELCKVSLWMEALEPGRPLSFLDHNIALGNSLLGATPELIANGIPDSAYKPFAGDEKPIAEAWKKRNRVEAAGTQTLFDADGGHSGLARLAEQAAGILAADDRDMESIRSKETRHRELLGSEEYLGARLAADAWCAAFVARKRVGATPITSAVVERAAKDPQLLDPALRAEIGALAAEYRFFHWHLAFPEVFDTEAGGKGGFDVVLGNPPWEHTELKEKEFFAERAPAIAAARTKAIRQRMIDALATKDPKLHREFEVARRRADGISHTVRNSGAYPLSGRGRINTYAIFSELNRHLVAGDGRVGCIVPTGIATDDTTKLFFQDLVSRRVLVSLFDFENREGIFPAVHRSTKFCLLTLTGGERDGGGEAEFVFFASRPEDLADPDRRFTLSAEEIELLNPNTKTCPIFRTRRDAEITKGIYQRVPVLDREGDPDGNPWGVLLKQGLLNMASDSGLFHTRAELEADDWAAEGSRFVRGGEAMLPLYEGKMFHQFDHRWATYEPEAERPRLTTPEERRDPGATIFPRYWVAGSEIDERLDGRETEWLLGWRDICRASDERTLIASVTPRAAAPDNFLLMLDVEPARAPLLLAVLNSFVADFAARQKVGGIHLKFFTMRQLPIPRPDAGLGAYADHLDGAVVELTYTAEDLSGFARDLGYEGPPFRWDPERRALLRAELDAAMFHLYGVGREDAEYVMDTFPLVRERDEEEHGEYRAKRLVLEIFDEMERAAASGEPYSTRLDPPPGTAAAPTEAG